MAVAWRAAAGVHTLLPSEGAGMRWAGVWVAMFALSACGQGATAPIVIGSGDGGSGSVVHPDAGPDAGAGGGPNDAGPAADCTGIVPASVGTALAFDVPDSAGKICAAATCDGNGMLIAESHDAGTSPAPSDEVVWNVFDVRGTWQGNFKGGASIFPQPAGFAGYSAGFDTLWDAYGSPKNFVAVDARPVLVPGYASGTIAFGTAGTSGLTVHRVAATGSETAAGTAPVSGTFLIRGGAEERSGAVVVVFEEAGGERFIWFDPALRVSLARSDLGPVVHEALARPLIGGGVAVRLDGHWAATLQPGDATVHPPPAFLGDSTDFAPARGGQAYAVWQPGRSAVELVSAAGNSCGTLTFAGVSGVSLGQDGTVIGATSAGCTKVFWHAALK